MSCNHWSRLLMVLKLMPKTKFYCLKAMKAKTKAGSKRTSGDTVERKLDINFYDY